MGQQKCRKQFLPAAQLGKQSALHSRRHQQPSVDEGIKQRSGPEQQRPAGTEDGRHVEVEEGNGGKAKTALGGREGEEEAGADQEGEIGRRGQLDERNPVYGERG
jgi:hypothetical protein